LDATAQKRLRVIQELTELGSGFKLAIRDLEIRGAGNLLGAEQHGQIAAVGFDLYCQLLEQAVRELSGEAVTEDVDPVVTVEAEAFIPEEYVADVHQRLALYKRLAALRDEAKLEEIRAELLDRFGPVPNPVRHLLEVVDLRILARRLGIEKLEAVGEKALVTFAPSTSVPPERLLALIRGARGKIRMIRDYLLESALPRGGWGVVHQALRELLERLA
jgi:transcription-repair coupling factor (superfamily II helicase)